MQRLGIISICVAVCLTTGCMMGNPDKQAASNELRMSTSETDRVTALPPLNEDGTFALQPEPVLAPPFDTTLAGGGKFVLVEALAAGAVVLVFYPANDTPNTTRDLIKLARAHEDFVAHSITVYAVGPGTAAEHEEYRQHYNIELPLLADPGLSIARVYGCVSATGRYPQRTVVGISPEGEVVLYLRRMATAKEILEGFGISTNGAD